MGSSKKEKPVAWIGSSHDDWTDFTDDIQDVMGYGFKGAGTLEIVDDFDGDTYRAIYTVRFKDVVYVLHAFQKKSKRGIATPKQEINMIEKRLKSAGEHYDRHYKKD